MAGKEFCSGAWNETAFFEFAFRGFLGCLRDYHVAPSYSPCRHPGSFSAYDFHCLADRSGLNAITPRRRVEARGVFH